MQIGNEFWQPGMHDQLSRNSFHKMSPKQTLRSLGRLLLGERKYASVARLIKPRREAKDYHGRRIEGTDEEGAATLSEVVRSGHPATVGKIGASELRACREAEELRSGRKSKVLCSILHELHLHSGVFPPTQETLIRFADAFVEAAPEIDVLGVWFLDGERNFVGRHVPKARLIRLIPLEPYTSKETPWSALLAGKRVVVVSPFTRSIESQYARRGEVWRARPEVLPGFQLRTVRVPLSDCLVKSPYPDWFAALDALKRKLASEPFDVAIIGAGAFSIPLAVEAKRLGGIGIHLGGATQLLFGILGGRWEDSECLRPFVNDSWVRPSGDERPARFRKMEGGSYW